MSQPWLVEAVGTAEWTGTPLRLLLEEADLLHDAVEIVFTGLDHGMEGGIEQDYAGSLSIAEASGDDVLLAYEMNGEPLLPQHGFPLRLVVPGWYGMTNVKWLARSRRSRSRSPASSRRRVTGCCGIGRPGYAGHAHGARALMVPPGFPIHDAPPFRRARDVSRSWTSVVGVAPVTRVHVSADLGETWNEASLADAALGPYAWRAWNWTWEPTEPGDYELWCRASDAAGNEQPVTADWNVKGYANNSVQRVPVTVMTASGSG